MSALRRMRETDRPIAFKPWIYEIAKNACIDEFRRSRRSREVSFEEGDGSRGRRAQCARARAAPQAAVESKQRLDDLCGAFGGLSESHHRVLVLRELEGLSYSEIGERLGMTRAMVESTLFRARRRLSEEYEELASGRRCARVQSLIESGARAAASVAGDPRPAAADAPSRALPAVPAARADRRDRREPARAAARARPARGAAAAAAVALAARRLERERRGAVGIALHRVRAVASERRPTRRSARTVAALGRAAAAAAALVIAGAGGGRGRYRHRQSDQPRGSRLGCRAAAGAVGHEDPRAGEGGAFGRGRACRRSRGSRRQPAREDLPNRRTSPPAVGRAGSRWVVCPFTPRAEGPAPPARALPAMAAAHRCPAGSEWLGPVALRQSRAASRTEASPYRGASRARGRLRVRPRRPQRARRLRRAAPRASADRGCRAIRPAPYRASKCRQPARFSRPCKTLRRAPRQTGGQVQQSVPPPPSNTAVSQPPTD